MKKFSFNFGKAAALVLGVTAFLFAGCDQSLAGVGGTALTGKVEINGTAEVDQFLTATVSELATAASALEKQYQWQNKAAAPDAVWENILLNAAGETYQLTGEDREMYIRVLVSVTGYRGSIAPETPAGPVRAAGTSVTKYNVNIGTITKPEGKTAAITANPSPAAANETVTLTINATDCKLKGSPVVTKSSGGAVDVTGSGTGYTFTMPAENVTVTAEFEALAVDEFTVTSSGLTNGTVTADKSPAKQGDTITLTATANPGYQLSGAPTVAYGTDNTPVTPVNGSGTTYTFTMPAANVTVQAEFEAITYNITVNVPGNGGSVTANPTTATVGTQVTLTVTPDSGKKLKSLSVNSGAVTVSGSGTTYTFTMPAAHVTVQAEFEAAEQTPGVGGDSGLAAVKFKDTVNNSSADEVSGIKWSILDSGKTTGKGTATEGWTLDVTEKPHVYFAVEKAGGQTITVNGDDADKVTVTTDGSAVDGTTTSNTLAAVTVDASDFDTMFDGGVYSFALNVAEGGSQIKTINVTLNNKIDKTYGVTIFKVTYPDSVETLEKLDAKINPVTTSQTIDEDKTTWQNNAAPVDTLYDANRWLEHSDLVVSTADSPGEYLIRLNKDQSTLRVNIELAGRQNPTVRIRGTAQGTDGAGKTIYSKITPNEGVIKNTKTFNYGPNRSSGLICVGHENNANVNNLTLKLENLTLDGLDGLESRIFVNSATLYSLIRMNNTVTVVMDNATITGFKGEASGSNVAPVYTRLRGNTFLMKNNSAITGNTFTSTSTTLPHANQIYAYNLAKTSFTFKRDASSTISGNIPDNRKVVCTATSTGGELYGEPNLD